MLNISIPIGLIKKILYLGETMGGVSQRDVHIRLHRQTHRVLRRSGVQLPGIQYNLLHNGFEPLFTVLCYEL